jgi:hypothetical protein
LRSIVALPVASPLHTRTPPGASAARVSLVSAATVSAPGGEVSRKDAAATRRVRGGASALFAGVRISS